MKPLPAPTHGTRSRYQLRREPCRCADCRRANADYIATYRRERAELDAAWEWVDDAEVPHLQGVLAVR